MGYEPLPRTASEQKAICTEIRKEELTEGIWFSLIPGAEFMLAFIFTIITFSCLYVSGVTISDRNLLKSDLSPPAGPTNEK
jgi:hypothetical protein